MSRSSFPLTTMNVVLDGNYIEMTPGKIVDITLDKAGDYDVRVSSYWMERTQNVSLTDGDRVVIKHSVPDWYYMGGISTVVFLSTLTYLTSISEFIVISAIGIYLLPIILITFIWYNKYYKIFIK